MFGAGGGEEENSRGRKINPLHIPPRSPSPAPRSPLPIPAWRKHSPALTPQTCPARGLGHGSSQGGPRVHGALAGHPRQNRNLPGCAGGQKPDGKPAGDSKALASKGGIRRAAAPTIPGELSATPSAAARTKKVLHSPKCRGRRCYDLLCSQLLFWLILSNCLSRGRARSISHLVSPSLPVDSAQDIARPEHATALRPLATVTAEPVSPAGPPPPHPEALACSPTAPSWKIVLVAQLSKHKNQSHLILPFFSPVSPILCPQISEKNVIFFFSSLVLSGLFHSQGFSTVRAQTPGTDEAWRHTCPRPFPAPPGGTEATRLMVKPQNPTEAQRPAAQKLVQNLQTGD